MVKGKTAPVAVHHTRNMHKCRSKNPGIQINGTTWSARGFQVHTPATLPKTKAISVNTSMVGGQVNFQASLEMTG
jgi:hypothetical protein